MLNGSRATPGRRYGKTFRWGHGDLRARYAGGLRATPGRRYGKGWWRLLILLTRKRRYLPDNLFLKESDGRGCNYGNRHIEQRHHICIERWLPTYRVLMGRGGGSKRCPYKAGLCAFNSSFQTCFPHSMRHSPHVSIPYSDYSSFQRNTMMMKRMSKRNVSIPYSDYSSFQRHLSIKGFTSSIIACVAREVYRCTFLSLLASRKDPFCFLRYVEICERLRSRSTHHLPLAFLSDCLSSHFFNSRVACLELHLLKAHS